MIYEEETYVELKDGRRGLVVLIRENGRLQYDIELSDGELTTVYREEVARPIELPTA